MSDNLLGEFLSLDTAKRLHKEKENKIDKNILEANIKLVDENKLLKMDNELLNKRIKDTKELLDSLIIFWKKYTHDNSLEIGQIERIKNTLDGLDVE